MAFVLVGLMILFGMVGIFYLSIRVNSIKEQAGKSNDDRAREMLATLASSPELSFSSDGCTSCIDMDKVLALKERKEYSNFWGFDYLAIERISPKSSGECNKVNYPNCRYITVVNQTRYVGVIQSAFVSICRIEFNNGAYTKCELGKLEVSAKDIK